MNRKNIVHSVFMCLFSFAVTVEFSKTSQGIPVGFLGDCPGFLKPAAFKPKTLEKLTMSILSPGNVLKANWTKYSYSHVAMLAKHPALDFKRKTVLIMPGYLDTIKLPLGRTMGTLYTELGYNVLLLDYFELTAQHFPVAARLIYPIAKHAAEMLVILTNLGLNPKNLELVGFSLGGQGIGLIAKRYRHITGRNISSLTALDPAGPCFRHLGSEHRLDASDADFVLQITTNMDGFGIATPVGHVSIFVNGGEYQSGDAWNIPCLVLCSHSKAYQFWLSALMNPGIFIALQCDSVQQARDSDCYERQPRVTNTMDLFTDRTKPGIYYLHTFNRYPYGVGRGGLKRKHNEITKRLNWLNGDDVLLVK